MITQHPQTQRFWRLATWLLLALALSAAVAHGCHAGGHDDADLLLLGR